MINADDLENWTKGQWGLESNGGDWVSFHRNFGRDTRDGDITYLEQRHFRGGDAQPVRGLVEVHVEPSGRRLPMSDQLKKRLLEDVVIFSGKQEVRPAPNRSPPIIPRASAIGRGRCPSAALFAVRTPHLQQQVEQFLFHQAELLDTKNWQAYIDLFAERGLLDAGAPRADRVAGFAVDLCRRPAAHDRAHGADHASERVVAGAAVGNQPRRRQCGDRGIGTEPRSVCARASRCWSCAATQLRSFAGTYRHTLLRRGEDFKIELQRVDLMNAQAPFDYTIQAWV